MSVEGPLHNAAPAGQPAGRVPDVALLRRAEAVFLELIELPRELRPARLAERAAGDGGLLAEVRSLLSSHDSDAEFLNTDELRPKTVIHDEAPLPARTRIGGYTIVQTLGTGGMGIVYVAEQERPRRTVALKLIKAAVATRALVRRFEHEAEVLGRLQHPGIAQIFEAGFAELETLPGIQLPYIAMELVRGVPLLDYVRSHGSTTRDRLELIARTCDAVHHAHQRSVIHRDLKPLNILVDELGQPKVLDFGIARVADAERHAGSMHTAEGQIIGTLAYMSPEQVEAGPAGIDVRSDVYALGVILYQLLAGRLPLDLAGKSVPEAARIVRDVQPARLSTIDRALRGDVETMVHRAIEKDRARRYQSAAELASDIRRFLAGLPIDAKRDSAAYVLGTHIRRHALLVTIGAAVVLALAALSASVFVQSRANASLAESYRQESQRADAERQRANLELALSNVERARLLTTLGTPSTAEEMLWLEFLRRPEEPATYWALWEFMSRVPIISMRPADSLKIDAGVAGRHSADAFLVLADGSVERRADLLRTVVWRVPGPSGDQARKLSLARDGRSLVVVGRSGARVLATADGTEILSVPAINEETHHAALSADGSLLAVSKDSKSIAIWSVADRRVVAQCTGARGAPIAMLFSADASLLYGAGNDPVIRIWRTADGSSAGQLQGHRQRTRALALSPDGRTLYSGGIDRASLPQRRSTGEIREWDLATSALRRTIPLETEGVETIDLTASGGRIAASGDECVEIVDLATGRRRTIYRRDESESIAAFWLGSGESNPRIFAYQRAGPALALAADPDAAASVRDFGDSDIGFFESVLSPDGRMLAVASRGNVALYDFRTGRPVAAMPTRAIRVRAMAFDAEQTMFAYSDSGGRFCVWDLAAGVQIFSAKVEGDEVAGLAFISPHRLAALGLARELSIFDTRTGDRLTRMDVGSRITVGFDVREDLDLCAIGAWDNQLTLVSLSRERVLESIPVANAPHAVRFSPRGDLLAAAEGRYVSIFDAARRTRVRQVGRLRSWAVGVAWSPDGSILASGDHAGEIRLSDPERGLSLMTLRQGGEVRKLHFSRDGRYLISAGDAFGVRVFDLAAFEDQMLACLPYWAGTLATRSGTGIDAVRSRQAAEKSIRSRGAVRERLAVPGPAGAVGIDEIFAWGRGSLDLIPKPRAVKVSPATREPGSQPPPRS
jgi:WD40 repeat protein